ncbi:hypothetical protein AOLI_G00278800 [Acnodon oligacanthus]
MITLFEERKQDNGLASSFIYNGTMSRATSKSRADKGRATSTQLPPPTQSPDVVDIVCGRLTESEWLSMISEQDGEDVVADTVEELLNSVMEKCYELDLKEQIVPFCVAWAKDAMVQVINCQYPICDEGDEANIISDLQEDTEPLPSIPDSWAEGCVPVIRIPSPAQDCKSDVQEDDVKDPSQKQRRQSMKKSESPHKESRAERKRSSRPLKLIPTQAKLELPRRPHPPEIPSPNKLKTSTSMLSAGPPPTE